MASHWPDELQIGLATSVVPHFRKFDFREGAPYPVADPDEYMPERPVAMRIAGAGIPGNVIVYMRLVYRQFDSGLRCAYGNARQIQANGVLRIRAAPGRASHECGRVCHRNARGRNTSRPCCVAESPWADDIIGSWSPEERSRHQADRLRGSPVQAGGRAGLS